MGTGSKVASVILRFGAFASGVIVVACLGRFFYYLNLANAHANSRLIYAEVISVLEVIFALLLIVPAKYSFYAFPIDIIFFICSIIAFALLANLNSSCSSAWYYNYWGFYWGRFWTVPNVTVATIGSAGCRTWRTILAFLFIGAMCWMLSAILGAFVFSEIRKGREVSETHRTTAMKEKILHHKKHDSTSTTDPESHPQPVPQV
ncbi:hypothetical protein DPSP01_006147 [Paraphaeosphaeria sporulosa]|uniref:MARVEL domain-containing protein n=1 Tax=Paraphaeosphaeria sporulosa TaxID=1460663 RepID=A0A177BTP8_9PLEO|nr:uncharacterized protein CC84DRAFT_1264775 [Paraphaeosphaeria sporulosa]OAF98783.1 hypothetical protein CC84DRAFT_1264775 [Paraphaeosphaeria sporulosa]